MSVDPHFAGMPWEDVEARLRLERGGWRRRGRRFANPARFQSYPAPYHAGAERTAPPTRRGDGARRMLSRAWGNVKRLTMPRMQRDVRNGDDILGGESAGLSERAAQRGGVMWGDIPFGDELNDTSSASAVEGVSLPLTEFRRNSDASNTFTDLNRPHSSQWAGQGAEGRRRSILFSYLLPDEYQRYDHVIEDYEYDDFLIPLNGNEDLPHQNDSLYAQSGQMPDAGRGESRRLVAREISASVYESQSRMGHHGGSGRVAIDEMADSNIGRWMKSSLISRGHPPWFALQGTMALQSEKSRFVAAATIITTTLTTTPNPRVEFITEMFGCNR
eukprot:CAMPEP_0184681980 /NCGR_PEP_ID=MMETSP0312-20130426/5146_1 /TAXON_ID=31354 /ORGANISM="Compsopogon coeruleus, Strain SAG 36.94" /LENGTH=330 /DNA_ID=CAMNT_0027133173 /DNA_START=215 /DNA_END=1208 /DNA_ORIENTATION=-